MINNKYKKGDFGYKDFPTILLENRIIMLTGEVNESMAYSVTSALHILDAESHEPIHIYINSPGGSCIDGLAIIDTMNLIKSPVYTYCIGMAASMGAVILCSGEKGHRYATPNSRILFHQVSSGMSGNIHDMDVAFDNTKEINKRLKEIICKNCGIKEKDYEKLTQRDYWIWADKAKEFGEKGAIDEVIKGENDEQD